MQIACADSTSRIQTGSSLNVSYQRKLLWQRTQLVVRAPYRWPGTGWHVASGTTALVNCSQHCLFVALMVMYITCIVSAHSQYKHWLPFCCFASALSSWLPRMSLHELLVFPWTAGVEPGHSSSMAHKICALLIRAFHVPCAMQHIQMFMHIDASILYTCTGVFVHVSAICTS